ncbi:MAG TPA: response regulator transcription factor [Desulfuromonadales bacterium]|nr:response regulator transcription factor [Desulfuromonadales bacterium]
MPQETRVVLVEDDADLRESLRAYLQKVGLKTACVGSAHAYLEALGASRFDIAVLDIGLPDRSGLELARLTREKTCMGIVFLTGSTTDSDQIRGYEAGGDVYLMKPVDCRVLAASIQSLAARLCDQRQEKDDNAVWTLSSGRWLLTDPTGREIRLTAKELRLIEVLASSHGHAVSRHQIAESLYPRDDIYTSRALDALIRRLRVKIGQRESDAPLRTVHGIGYAFAAPLLMK